MAEDMQRLVVSLEARIDSFEKALNRATGVANDRTKKIEDRFKSANSKMIAGMSGMGKAALLNQLATERMTMGMSSFATAAPAAGAAARRLSGDLTAASSSSLGMGTALGTLGAYLTVSELKDYSDGWQTIQRTIAGGEAVFGMRLRSAEELNKLANDSRVDNEAYAKLYVRTAAATRELGASEEDVAKVTTTVSKALKLGSASASEQASVMLQLSQALTKGKLDGDEFRTVMENASVIQELLADKLKVSRGEIIRMAADGKISVQALFTAMLEGGDKVDRIFNKMPATIEESFTVLRNSVEQYIGSMNKATGASEKVTGVVALAARNIETMGDAALVLAAGMLAAFSPAIIGSIGSMGLAIGGLVASTGPFGLMLAALAAGHTAYALFGTDIKVTTDGAVTLKDRVDALTQSLNANRAAAEANSRFATIGPRGGSRIPPANVNAEKDRSILTTGRRGVASQMRLDERQIALGRGFADSTVTLNELDKKPNYPSSPDTKQDKRTDYERETFDIQKRTAALIAQADVIGSSTLVLERAKVQRELLTAAEETAKKTGIAITPQQLADIDQLAIKYAGVSAQVEYLNALQGQKDAGDKLRDEIALIGLQGEELEKARIQQELLNAAKKAGVEITPALLAQNEAIAEQNAHLKHQLEVIADIRNESADALKSFISDMREGKSATEALGNALNKMADKLIDMAVNGLVESALGALVNGGGTGGTGGASGASGILSLLGFANGGVMVPGKGAASLPRFASGGVSRSAAIFGEAGPEAAVPLPDGRSIPVTLRMPSMPSVAQSQTAPNLSLSLNIDARGATPETSARLKSELVPTIQKVVRSEVNQLFDRSSRFARTGI